MSRHHDSLFFVLLTSFIAASCAFVRVYPHFLSRPPTISLRGRQLNAQLLKCDFEAFQYCYWENSTALDDHHQIVNRYDQVSREVAPSGYAWRGVFARLNNLTSFGNVPTTLPPAIVEGRTANASLPTAAATAPPTPLVQTRAWEKVVFYTLASDSGEEPYLWQVHRGEDFNATDHSLKTKDGKFLALDLRAEGMS